MDSDEEDFVFVGTAIEREEEITTRKKKALAEASGHLRTLPAWKQEVTDEEGRRRFHGAFTGGFSAGYYNTVGSKEGWTPQTFTSSRKNRAEVKQLTVLDFLDEDEKAEMGGNLLGTSSQFDTFGFTAAGLARKQAEKEQKQRPSAIPGPIPDELVVPASESIGVKLLLKMGWRHGRPIKDSRANSLYDARREARKAFLAFASDEKTTDLSGPEAVQHDPDDIIEDPANENDRSPRCTPVYVRHPKQDLFGLGYDPYKHAPEFREKKRSRLSENRDNGNRKSRDNLVSSKSRRLAPGFGIGALEELDVEDEDIYASGYDYANAYVDEDEEPSRLTVDDKKSIVKVQGIFPRFKAASNSQYQLERFDPPAIPTDFVPRHKFPAPLDVTNNLVDAPPPEVPPPEDNNLKVMIEGIATLVARSGKLFEDLSREKNQSNPLFSFLFGGTGRDYYERRLWEERQKKSDKNKWQSIEKSLSGMQKLTADNRGKLLGERPLERSFNYSSSSGVPARDLDLKSNRSNVFSDSESFRELLETAKPFKDDPAKQERFEQFLKDKYRGGLRSTDLGEASKMSESARARERLDFEAAAETLEKAKSANQDKLSAYQFMDFTMASGLQFTSSGTEQVSVTQSEDSMSKKMYPKREMFEWRPAPLLCKRFDIIDPYMGKPPPAPRPRSKLDSLVFMPGSVKSTKTEEVDVSSEPSLASLSNAQKTASEPTFREVEAAEVENVERPVDLYKAIFSDSEDDEEGGTGLNNIEDPQKKNEAATSALSRLIAGDFLESLGQELGLEVPPDQQPLATNNDNSQSAASHKYVHTDTAIAGPVPNDGNGHRVNEDVTPRKELDRMMVDEDRCLETEKGRLVTPRTKDKEDHDHVNRDKTGPDHRKGTGSSHQRGEKSSASSSEDERSRKRSRRHRHRSSDSESESSDDYRDRHNYSRSKDERRRSSRKKHRRRKHSRRK